MRGTPISEEDTTNLNNLYNYSRELKDIINQLEVDLYSGDIKWGELEKKGGNSLEEETNNLSKASFSNINSGLNEYAGLIYDGAFSEHMTNPERVGLTGNEINEEEAKQKAREFIAKEKELEIISNGQSQNGNIEGYSFTLKESEDILYNILVSKIGGHIVAMNSNRDVIEEKISVEEAVQKGKMFLESRGFKNMKETYYIKMDNIVTANLAYEQDGILMYPDLIKVKISLDNGEVLGIETTGYLNSHKEKRELKNPKISMEEAKSKLNPKLDISSDRLAVIPTKWNTEVFCYEFKGNINGNDFLIYINAETGEEQDILMIINTPDGTLTE